MRSGVAVGILMASDAGAWMAICHYLIAKEARDARLDVTLPVEDYASLPDYHSNIAWNPDVMPPWLGVENAPEFCWSHGLITEHVGVFSWSGMEWGMVKLHYGADGRMPEDAMESLLVHKLRKGRFANQSAKDAAKCTINGFIAHNRADAVVHFGFFGQETHLNWVVHHGLKETYAEYHVLAWKRYGGNCAALFNPSHTIDLAAATPSLPAGGIPAAGTLPAETAAAAQLMHMGQLAYRKNRYKWSVSDPDPFVVKGPDDIAGTIAHAAEDFRLWSKPRWGKWAYLGIRLAPTRTWVDGSGTTQETENEPPDSLEEEYQQLLEWYEWSQAMCSGDVARWDNQAIRDRFDSSVGVVQGALKSDAALEPQG
jgi:hypothetical protein